MLRSFVFARTPGSFTSGSLPESSASDTVFPKASFSTPFGVEADASFVARSLALIVLMLPAEAIGQAPGSARSKKRTTSSDFLNRIEKSVGGSFCKATSSVTWRRRYSSIFRLNESAHDPAISFDTAVRSRTNRLVAGDPSATIAKNASAMAPRHLAVFLLAFSRFDSTMGPTSVESSSEDRNALTNAIIAVVFCAAESDFPFSSSSS